MPAPGEQHKAWQNPFEEPRPRVAEWSAKEIATIAARLDKQLGPEFISARSGPGGTKVHYLTAEKCISLANEVFGFNGWSSSIQNIQVDFADENPQTQRVSIGLSVIVRITLCDGTYHEDIGYGSIENAKGKAMAFEKAKKEGTTDGMKRALRNFGNVLGNCIYDQNYVKEVVKIKAQPVRKFNQDNLHRHSTYIKPEAKEEAATVVTAATAPGLPKMHQSESFEDFLGELDEADFCVSEGDHPDEITLPAPERPASNPRQQQQPSRAPSAPPHRAPQTPNQPQQQRPTPQQRPQPIPQPQPTFAPAGAGPPPGADGPVAFFSAKAVSQLPEGAGSALAPAAQQLFNPKAESPSIRKTPGIDHSSSRPLARTGQHIAPPTSSQTAASPAAAIPAAAPSSNTSSFTPVRPTSGSQRASVMNANLEHARRIGAPSGPGSPLNNRSSFRQPTMKRPSPVDARPPLADIPTNAGVAPNTGDGTEAKRQKTG